MSAADYRLLTEATGQRIAAALEALGVNAVQKSDIVDNLNSSDATKVLSAKQGKVLKDAIDTNNADMAIIINGNQTALGAAQGDYVLVRNSTITGISDGLYKAAAAIPANTAITSASLTAVSGGGFNDLQDQVVALNSQVAYLTNNDLSADVDLTQYNYDTAYEAPSDGYVCCSVNYNGNNGDYAHAYIIGSNRSYILELNIIKDSDNNYRNSLFVKKGMYLYAVKHGSFSSAVFKALV